MSRLKAFHVAIFFVFILFLVGCSAPIPDPPTATPVPPTATPVPPTATSVPVEEKYEQVSPSELKMDIQTEFNGRVEWDKDGNVTKFEGGKITRFTVAGKPIALSSNDFLWDNQKVYIDTKDYGKFLISFNYNSMGLWLKPSQIAKIKALAQ